MKHLSSGPYMYTQKIANIFDHIRAILAIYHSRLCLKNKFLENKSGRIFCVRQVYLPTNLGACKPIFYTFYTSHLRSEVKQYSEALFFIIQTSDRMQCFTILQYKLHSLNIQERWKHAWTFSETVKNISKITYTASRYSLWQAPNEWTITELRFHIIKNLLCLFFI